MSRTATRPRLHDPLASLDVATFVDLVRSLRSAQLADAAAGGDFATKPARILASQLDEWLLDLGRPPSLPLLRCDDDPDTDSIDSTNDAD